MKKFNSFFLLIICICSCVLLYSVAYSAFSSTMSVSGTANARMEKNVRITNFVVSDISYYSYSSYEKFSVSNVLTEVTLPNEESTITYKIEITNYGSTDVAITNITGLPSNLSYEIKNYSLKEKICSDSGDCNLGAKKQIWIIIKYKNYDSSNTTYSISLDFEFKNIYGILYKNISDSNNYQSEIIEGDTLEVDFGTNKTPGVLVNLGSNMTEDYSYVDGVVKISNIVSNVEIEGFNLVEEFDYTGSIEKYDVLYPGIYKLETWGAQGGDGYYGVEYDGGVGGYSVGNILLTINDDLYIVVGSKGESNCVNSYCVGGYNGGGESGNYLSDAENYLGAGGGATHIATKTGLLAELSNDVEAVLIVSGGGGGSGARKEDGWIGGAGGGYLGNDGVITGTLINCGKGGSQESGGYSAKEGTANGTFGQAGYFSGDKETLNHNGSGGGGGYYGGGFGGGAGSGYIGNPLLTNKYMMCYECATSEEESIKTFSSSNTSDVAIADYSKIGNGYARVTLIEMIKR